MIVGKAAGLWEPIHAASDFDVYNSVMYEWRKVVLIDDGLCDHVDGYAHVFIARHRRAQIEILEVGGHVASIWCGDCAVDEQLGGGEVAVLVLTGRIAATTRRYVALRPLDMSRTLMKKIVLVPLTVPKPWARSPILSAFEPCQRGPLLLWLSSQYSASLPVSGLNAFP